MLHVPCPGELAGPGIKSLDHSRWRAAALAVENLVTDNDDPANDGWRRVDARGARWHPTHSDLGVLLSAAIEVGARLAGHRIDLDQPRIHRALDDPRSARTPRSSARHFIITQSAARGGVRDPLVRHLRVDPPDRFSGRRIDRDDHILGGAGVKEVAGLERRVLGPVELHVIGIVGLAVDMDLPDLAQLADIVGIDLGQRSEPPRRVRSAISKPVGAGAVKRWIDKAWRTLRGKSSNGGSSACPQDPEAGDHENHADRDPAPAVPQLRLPSRGVRVGITRSVKMRITSGATSQGTIAQAFPRIRKSPRSPKE